MYLTDKKTGQPRLLNDHEELEMLLESFAKQVEEIVNEAESIQVMNMITEVLHMADRSSRATFNPRRRLSSSF